MPSLLRYDLMVDCFRYATSPSLSSNTLCTPTPSSTLTTATRMSHRTSRSCFLPLFFGSRRASVASTSTTYPSRPLRHLYASFIKRIADSIPRVLVFQLY